MNDSDLVVLVPGLFGFGKLEVGRGTLGYTISYFDHVARQLARRTGRSEGLFIVADTPPTAALTWRVKKLFEQLESLLQNPHPVTHGPIGKVHLIGHSTGGVDIRLLLNAKYSWANPPSAIRRQAVQAQIGQAVSLSAPLHGTPIARRLRGSLETTIPLLFAVSILGKLGTGTRIPLKLAAAVGSALLSPGALVEAGTLDRLLRQVLDESKRADADDASTPTVTQYLKTIVADHPLLDDLTAFAMHRLNQSLAGGDRPDPPLRCFVTVAPEPRLHLLQSPLKLIQASSYRFSYDCTRPSPGAAADAVETGAFPQGEWLLEPGLPPEKFARLTAETRALETDCASDGVVTAWSQTISGTAEGLVYGDHLDVVGHYDSEEDQAGTTVFNSDAGFDDARFQRLWNAIGDALV